MLVLYRADPKFPTALPLPFPLDATTAPQFVANWLAHATYPVEPEHDGSNEKGWHVFIEEDDCWEVLLTVQPCWAMHGK